ncbi:hypothetical protein DFQ14_11429 [Halopolyspora algeriensis]|uniref:Uncharacterized protein n=1 Tax=Halopolyspora algeriensis TaxID=1500506 RepID=A0A368VF46_9ACTN|nr:hypothetical protein [Halopolyspora algeriensis]RCW39768.1 hypothetical protein DFQ14_11429 [Halopolyspora algeriensis]TQM56423.1 hypothetical protein FHU43_1221 [Halopolyspora algeriensis]
MTETWETQRGALELLSMVVIGTGVPLAGESTALQVIWLLALVVAAFVARRQLGQASPAPH